MARPRRRSGNLPAEITSFIGRRRELGEVRKKLSTARLISLVGPGGVGKSRLAMRSGSDLGRGFAGGAWWVELAEVRDPALVTNAVLAALELRDQAGTQPRRTLLSYLQDKRLLLLLDNCEHLLAGVAELVDDLLRAVPDVRVITTSREPLQTNGEHVVPVPPLELPQGDGVEPLARLRQNESVMLFEERAAAASGAFELTGSNQAAVVDLCRRLDGLPLAIELAAVRTRVLTVDQILDRLSDRFALLTGGGRAALPRQQTLRTTIDWSYDLLNEGEQILLRRMCAFAARFTLEDVEAVCAFDGLRDKSVLDIVSSLVDKSLVIREDFRGRACYRLHETMHEYAELKSREADEDRLLEERSLDYYLTRYTRSASEARYRLPEWLEWTELEIDNIRDVLQRCIARGELARGLDLAASMGYYWITRGTTESVRWLDQFLVSNDASPQTRVRACYLRGWLSVIQADAVTARPWIARAVAVAREAGLVPLLSESLSMAATCECVAGDLDAAARYIKEAEAITPTLHAYPATIELVQARAVHAFFRGDLETARTASVEGANLSREARDLYQVEAMLRNLGMVGMMTGDVSAAKAGFAEALRVARQIDNWLAQFYGLSALGWHAAASGQPRLAARLLGAAETVGTRAGADIMGPGAPFVAEAKELATAALGGSKFEAEFETGKQWSRDGAVRLALGEPDQADLHAREDVAPGPLAKREVDVAQLVAGGLSNKQIALRLFISEATVATHVRNIMNKLGFNSRAQIASWMASSNR